MKQHLTVTTTLRRAPSINRARFLFIQQHVLGKTYELSLVFIGDTRARSLNKKYRHKNTTANVLSFPLSDTEGEILINVPQAKREARQLGSSISNHILYLFIHGILHLKGYRHGATMEAEEQRLSGAFLT